MEGGPVFLSYHTFLRLICCFIPGLRSWNSEPSWRRLKLCPRYPVLHVIIRLASLSVVVSFSLDLRLWVCPNIGSCTPTHVHITSSCLTLPLIFRGCAFSDLVSLTNRIYSSMASPLILGRLAPLFSGFTHKSHPINHRLSDTRLSPSIIRYLCPIGTLVEEDSALPQWSEKKNQPRSQEI